MKKRSTIAQISHMMRLTVLLLVVLCLSLTWVQANTSHSIVTEPENTTKNAILVSGKVTDPSGSPVIGATVLEKGSTTNGTITDGSGEFTLNVPEGATLIFQYVGYVTKEIPATSQRMTVILVEGVDLSRVVVTATRSKARTELESAVPIDAIEAIELIRTGQTEIAQAIHFTVPSFSAQKFGINDLAPLIDPAQLRGLSSDQTLLLVNGKRRHKVAFFNGNDGVGKGQLGNDLNSIPTAAIQRVEVLRDGAAAQYGSDAIAGVINMQLKKNSSGGLFTAFLGSTLTNPKYDDITNQGTPGESIYDGTITDGQTFNSALNFGLPWGEEGFVSTTLTFHHANPTDRSGTYSHSSGWYTANQLFSVFDSATVLALDTDGDGSISNSEKASLDEQLQTQNGVNPDRAVLGTADNTNGGIFVNAGRPISDAWDFYLMSGITKKEIVGGVFTRTPSRTSRAVTDIFFDGFNPELPSSLTDWQAMTGIKGEIGDGFNLDFSMGYSGNDVQFYARNTVNPSMGAESPTQFYTGALRATQSILNLDLTKELSESVNLAVGSEYRYETYEQFEGQRESWFPGDLSTSGRDIGSSGREGFTPQSTGTWSRNNVGIYAELDAEISEAFLVNVAGRFENYSDFGADFSYKVATRYKVTDNIGIRGSVNRSFRAPALGQTHYSNFSQISFDADGGSVVSPTLPVRDNRVQTAFGIENLKPETSLDFALGATAKLLEGALKITLDAYQISVDDRIFIAQVAAADFPEFATSGFDDINFFTNAINTTTQGLDFVAAYKNIISETSYFNVSFAVNLNQTVIDELNTTTELAPHISFDRTNNGSDFFIYLVEGTPRSKIILSPTYKTGPVSFTARVSNFGQVAEPRLRYNAADDVWDDNPVGGGEPQILSPKTIVDFSISGHINEDLTITGTINNVFDVYPDMLREAQVRSEVIYSRRVNQFGTVGRVVNLLLSYSF